MIEEAHSLFESAPSKLSEDVAAHFRRQEVELSKSCRRQDEDTSKLLDRPPQFSSVHRVQTRRQAILQRSHVNTFTTRYVVPSVSNFDTAWYLLIS